MSRTALLTSALICALLCPLTAWAETSVGPWDVPEDDTPTDEEHDIGPTAPAPDDAQDGASTEVAPDGTTTDTEVTCAASCADDSGCPAGWTCEESASPSGAPVWLCAPSEGTSPPPCEATCTNQWLCESDDDCSSVGDDGGAGTCIDGCCISCTEDADCDGPLYSCDGGVCQGGDDMGADCTVDSDCPAGHTCEFPYCTAADPSGGGGSGGGCATGAAPLPQGLMLVTLLGLTTLLRRRPTLASGR